MIYTIIINIIALVTPRKSRVSFDIPYFSQWESPELVDDIIARKVSAVKDPLWHRSGAKDTQEYLHWTWNICGMACFKMILAKEKNKIYKIIDLAHRCESFGGYKVKPDSLDIDGLFYDPFVRFAAKEFNLKSRTIKLLTINRIKYELNHGNYIIASVHPSIRDITSPPPKKNGGHLILVTGYDDSHQMLTIHNPSGLHNTSQRNFQLSEHDFSRFFAHKGIVIYK